MATETFDSGAGDSKPTRGLGNAGGKPIRPILFGVAAVIALILVTLAFSRSPGRIIVNTSGPIPQARYTPSSTSSTALGQSGAAGDSDTASRPTAELNVGGTSKSGSSSMRPEGSMASPSPTVSQADGRASAGQNVVAPPGPAANAQGVTP